ncbi:MAG: YgiT-type zinc finger protein [Chloroflexi bacterium]|nr:YgiT-type zinc finger protein [Chloroflexota bacterium]
MCMHGQGQLARQRVSFAANRKGYHLIIDDLPAWVCEQCGEPMFDEETVNRVQEMLREVDARVEKLAALAIAA